MWTHLAFLIKSQSSGINLCYVKTVSSVFKLLCLGNIWQWVYWRSTKCVLLLQQLYPFKAFHKRSEYRGLVFLHISLSSCDAAPFFYITCAFIVVCKGPILQLLCVPSSYCVYWLNEPWKKGTARIILGSSHRGMIDNSVPDNAVDSSTHISHIIMWGNNAEWVVSVVSHLLVENLSKMTRSWRRQRAVEAWVPLQNL